MHRYIRAARIAHVCKGRMLAAALLLHRDYIAADADALQKVAVCKGPKVEYEPYSFLLGRASRLNKENFTWHVI